MNQRKERWPITVALLVLIVAAVVVRWLYTQRISLFFDEFTSLWAAKTVLDRGLPLLPSGNFYTHGLLFTYLEAPFLAAFGLDESLLRLPSLLVGVGTVLAVYLVGRRLFSAEAGLIAAAAVVMDPEAIAWGGRVRMYALLQLLVLLAIFVFYEGTVRADRPWQRWLALGLLVAAMFTHAEAALLLPALALALLVARGLRWALRPSVVGPFVLGLLGFVAVVFGVDLAARLGIDLGRASHLEDIHEVRPYLAPPTRNPLSGLLRFAPAFLDLWRLPFSLVAAVGLIYVVRRPERRSSLLYLYLVLGVVLAELFFLAGPTWQVPRYAFMMLPVLWLIVGAVVGRFSEPCPAWVTAAVALALAAFVGVVGYRTAFTQEWGYDRAFRYLQEEMQPGDVVLTTNPPAAALYLGETGIEDTGRVDHADRFYAMQSGYEEYVMTGSNGALVDRWVGTPVLDSVEQLEKVLATVPRVWFVADGWRFQSRFENDFIRSVLDQMDPAFGEQGMAVFVGQGYVQRPAPEVSRSVGTEFSQALVLDSYELSAARVQPGEELEVSLLWQALEAPGTAYTVFLHLIGPDGERVAQTDEPLLGGYYQPTIWPKGESVVDRHGLSLPVDLAPGRYRLEAGLYPPSDLQSDAGLAEGWAPVVLGYLTTEGWLAPVPETVLDVDFGGQIGLQGYTLDCDLETQACGIQLFWDALQPVEADYTVFAHLVGEDGAIVGQHDGMPEGGFYPTSAWQVGETVVDEHRFEIVEELPPGVYELSVGLYDLETKERLVVVAPTGAPATDRVVLTTLSIGGGE